MARKAGRESMRVLLRWRGRTCIRSTGSGTGLWPNRSFQCAYCSTTPPPHMSERCRAMYEAYESLGRSTPSSGLAATIALYSAQSSSKKMPT